MTTHPPRARIVPAVSARERRRRRQQRARLAIDRTVSRAFVFTARASDACVCVCVINDNTVTDDNNNNKRYSRFVTHNSRFKKKTYFNSVVTMTVSAGVGVIVAGADATTAGPRERARRPSSA